MKFIIILLFSVSVSAYASYYEECAYNFKIVKEDAKSISIDAVEFISGGGHLSPAEAQSHCMKILAKKMILKSELPKDFKIVLNKKIKAKRSYKNGMGVKGPVNSLNWSFINL